MRKLKQVKKNVKFLIEDMEHFFQVKLLLADKENK